jgi:tetratricopeptide (TPR) repeat protein
VRDAYEKSLELRLQDPHVLNNLAWFYATCEDQSLRDPKRALMLAKLAVELEPSSHALDTLAESYYVNEMIPEAIEAGERALNLTKENHSYYKDQLKKFKQAAASQ